MLTALALTAAASYCPVTVTRDYVLPGVQDDTYRAILKPAPGCVGQARVRKVSTINAAKLAQEPGGKDGVWAWNLNAVPPRKLWTLNIPGYTWKWQWWDGKAWQWAVTR